MAIERWDPFREVVSLRDAVGSLLADSFVRPSLWTDGTMVPIMADVVENENEFVVRASMPGVKPEDVQTTVHGDTLSIRGETKAEEEKKGETYHLRERRYGSFQRSFTFPTPINADKADAQFENGVLTLRLPKAESAKPKQIPIGKK